jgi:four helix bundle protein
MVMPTFRDLKVWREAIRLMLEVSKICKKLPREERFQLIDQSNRSASSIPDNIAEGYTAYYYKDKIHRFYDARKESGETQNHILKMEKKGYISSEVSERLFKEYQTLIMGLNGFINYIRSKYNNKR